MHQYAGLFSFFFNYTAHAHLARFLPINSPDNVVELQKEIIKPFPYRKIVFLVFLGLFNM